MRLIQPVRPTLEMSGKLLDSVQIRRDGRGREVTPLEFLQHDLATMGHQTPPVTPTLPGRSSEAWSADREFNCEHERAQLVPFLDLFVKDNRRNVYAGELEVRPPGAPTTGAG
jgi:hypothetical protein